MQWFIVSRDMHVLCAPSTKAPNSISIYNDKQTISITNNAVVSTYEFTIDQKHPDAKYFLLGNYIAFRDKYGDTKLYTMKEHHGDDLQQTWMCEDIGMDLINATADKWDYSKDPHPIAWYYENLVLKDTGWTLGVNEISNLSRGLSFDGQSDTLLTRAGDIANQFGGAEINFTVEMSGSQVISQNVNIYKKIGSGATKEKFIDQKNLTSLNYNGTIDNLCTSLIGYGGTPESTGDNTSEKPPIDISDLAYDDGQFWTVKGDKHLYDRISHKTWTRFRAYYDSSSKSTDGYINGIFTYDTTDPQELLNRMITELKSRNHPSETYEATLLKLGADIGDYIQIAHNNYNPPIYLSARVQQVENCYTAEGQDIGILGDYTRMQSNIDPRVQQLIDGLANSIKYNYTWIRYAKDDKGTDMTATPTTDTKYVAIVSNKPTGVPSDNPADYAEHWQLIKGSDGKDGIPGPKGEDGKTSYTHFAYADNVSGTEDFSVDNPTGRSYMGIYSDFTKADSTNPSDYVWSYTKGEAGPVGRDGAQGIPGKPGIDGKTPYTHVAYADDDKGGGFSQSPDNKAYMGWYSDFTQADSNDPSLYGWSLIKGADGETSYVHIAYADSADGTDGFYVGGSGTNLYTDTQNFNNLASWWGYGAWTKTMDTYKGLTVVQTTADWNGLSQYIKVKKGDILTYSIYAKYASGTGTSNIYWMLNNNPEGSYSAAKANPSYNYVNITDSWQRISSTVVATSDGYLRPRLERSNGNTNTLQIAGIKVSNDSNTSWSPAPSEAHPIYMGTYTDYTQTSSLDPTAYSWSQIKGADGQSVWSFPYNVGANVSGRWWSDLKPAPTTDNPPKVGDTIIDMIGNMYQITNVVVGTTQQGGGTFDYGSLITNIKGDKGKDGVAGKDGVGIKSTIITYQLSSSGTTTPTGTWSTTVPTLVKGQYLWTRTTLVYTDNTNENVYSVSYVAKDGNNGSDGVAGKDGVGIKSTAITYAASTSGTSAPTSGWVSTPPSATAGQFVWTRTIWTYTDNTTETGYSVGKIGEKGATGANGAPGKPGADGRTPYFHQAWADSKDGKINFSLTDATNRGYLGTYSDFTQADSTDPTKYFWVELVGNLQVGGRNYFLNSDFSQDETNWSDNNSIWFMSGEKCNGQKVMTATPTVAWTGGGINALCQTMSTITNQQVTVSVWAKASKSGAKFHSEPNGGNGAFNVSLTTTWKRYSYVAQTNTNGTIYFMAVDVGTQYWISMPQVEIGNKATDWTPAPEDTQGQIDKVNNGLGHVEGLYNSILTPIASVTAPTNPKNGQQWWVLDADSKTLGLKIWNGSVWKDATIQQSAMNIGTLNGNIINGATINTSDFNMSFDQTNAIDGVNKKGVTTIENGEIRTDFQIKNSTQTGYVHLTPEGLSTGSTNPNGTLQNSVGLAFGQINLATTITNASGVRRLVRGSLDAEDMEKSLTTYWESGDVGNRQKFWMYKQFRRVVLTGVILLPAAKFGTGGNGYRTIFNITDTSLRPLTTRWVKCSSFGDIPHLGLLEFRPNGDVVAIGVPSQGRYSFEGESYAIENL